MAKIYWNKKTIIDAMKTCHSRKEFKKRYHQAYTIIKRNGWQELYDEYIPYTSANLPKQWTKESIIEAMQTCHSRKEFQKRYPWAYTIVKRNGWRELYDEYIPRTNQMWTYEKARDEIRKYNSQKQVRQENLLLYSAIMRHGWNDLLEGLPEQPITPSEVPRWSVYKWYFIETHAVYIGLTCNFTRRIKEELLYSRSSPVHDYIERTGCSYDITELHSGLSSSEAVSLEIAYIDKYRTDGYTVLNRNSGGSLGGYNPILSKMDDDTLLGDIFKRYSTYKELSTQGKRYLREAKSRGLWQRILEVLPMQRSKPLYTREMLEGIVNQYEYREELRKERPHEYKYIIMHKQYRDMLPPKRPKGEHVSVPIDQLKIVSSMVADGTITKTEAGNKFGISAKAFCNIARENGICINRKRGSKRRWTREALIEAVRSQCKTLSDLRAIPTLYTMVKRRGLYKEISGMLEHKRRSEITVEMVKESVSKCKSLYEFRTQYQSEYQACLRNGWDDVLSTSYRTYKRKRDTPVDVIKACIAKCGSRKEFNTRFQHETYVAKKLGLYDELIKHLPKLTGKCKRNFPGNVSCETQETGSSNNPASLTDSGT